MEALCGPSDRFPTGGDMVCCRLHFFKKTSSTLLTGSFCWNITVGREEIASTGREANGDSMDIVGNGRAKSWLVQHHRGEAPVAFGVSEFHGLIGHTNVRELIARFDGIRDRQSVASDLMVSACGQYDDRGICGAFRFGDFVIESVRINGQNGSTDPNNDGAIKCKEELRFLDGVRDFGSGRFLSEVAQ